MATVQIDNVLLSYTFSQLTDNGIIKPTRDELVTQVTNNYKTIYGIDTNTDLASADSVLIQNTVQIIMDLLDYSTYLYNQMNLYTARGIFLDNLGSLVACYRRGATYTQQNIVVTTTQAMTLNGSNTSTPFTIQDQNGNKYELVNTTSVNSGTSTLLFKAVESGAIQSALNTITIFVNIIQGVSSVNNTVAPTSIGQIQETDPSYRLRCLQSNGIASRGFVDSIISNLQSIEGTNPVQSVFVDNNPNGVTNSLGTTEHSIHAVLDGGTAQDIGNVLVNTVPPGCGMDGSQTQSVPIVGGSPFIAKWDYSTPVPLYIRFSIQPTVSNATFDLSVIQNYIVTNLKPNIYETLTQTKVVGIAQAGVVSSGGFGAVESLQFSTDNTNWFNNAVPTAITQQFSISAPNITIILLSYPPTT